MNPDQLACLYDWFGRFVAGYAGETPADQRNYDLKIKHTYNVCAVMRRLAAAEGLVPDASLLAEAVALCHDVGRFPQYRQYRTFNDPVSVDHACLAVQTLREQGVLAGLAVDERELLLQGVALHNRFLLPDALTPAARRLALLIRDADKLDIWRVVIEYCRATPGERAAAVVWELPDTGRCSPQVINEVRAGRMVNRSLLATADDFKMLQLSWVFDLNFKESFAILSDAGYIADLAGLLPDDPGCRVAVAGVERYVAARRS